MNQLQSVIPAAAIAISAVLIGSAERANGQNYASVAGTYTGTEASHQTLTYAGTTDSLDDIYNLSNVQFKQTGNTFTYTLKTSAGSATSYTRTGTLDGNRIVSLTGPVIIALDPGLSVTRNEITSVTGTVTIGKIVMQITGVAEGTYGGYPGRFDVLSTVTLNGPAMPVPDFSIVTPPSGKSVHVGETSTFSVVANGTGLNYQWRKDGVSLIADQRITGVNSAALAIANSQTTDAGNYDVIVSKAASAITSPSAALTVLGSDPLDETAIRAVFASMKCRAEAHDLNGFMALFSADYMHSGKDYAAFRSEIQEVLPTVQAFSFIIDSIEGVGSNATVHGSCTITFNNGNSPASWTEPDTGDQGLGIGWLRKTTTGWQVVGNQAKAWVAVETEHGFGLSNPDSHLLRLRADSPVTITGVTVSGPQITATVLQPDPEYGGYKAFAFPSGVPPIGTVYSFDVGFADGTHQILQDAVKSWVPVAPTVSVTIAAGIATIHWTDVSQSVPNASYYWVWVTGNGVSWKSKELPLSRTSVAFNEDGGGTGTLKDGYTYTVNVFIFDSSEDYADVDFLFKMVPGEAPSITQQPQNLTNLVGSAATFKVTATGTAPLTYHWRFNGTNLTDGGSISGATNSSLSIANLQTNHAGLYSALVSNGVGNIPSSNAVLSIVVPVSLHFESVQLLGGALQTRLKGTANDLVLLECSSNMEDWTPILTNTMTPAGWPLSWMPNTNMRYYRASKSTFGEAPTGMALIPAGSFTMGDTLHDSDTGESPTHTVQVSAFYMDKHEVTKALWDDVYFWAVAHGYSFDNAGSGKASNHPVYAVNWYDVVKWCNARSEKEGRVPAYYTGASLTTVYRTGQVSVQNGWVKWNAGYRLPTEAEWEKAARGGASGHRFPWSNVETITHSQANYNSASIFAYDTSPTRGYHPSYDNDPYPYTSPVGSFAPNGYGLYDMAGNVCEWCWDWEGSYSSGSQSDPRGPSDPTPEWGSGRVFRDGGWDDIACYCRVAWRYSNPPDSVDGSKGFRSALPSGQP